MVEYKIIHVLSVKNNTKLNAGIYNEYSIKVKNINNGFIENQIKLIHIDEDKGQIKEGHIFNKSMYKK